MSQIKIDQDESKRAHNLEYISTIITLTLSIQSEFDPVLVN